VAAGVGPSPLVANPVATTGSAVTLSISSSSVSSGGGPQPEERLSSGRSTLVRVLDSAVAKSQVVVLTPGRDSNPRPNGETSSVASFPPGSWYWISNFGEVTSCVVGQCTIG
jgi:hypothetical protein